MIADQHSPAYRPGDHTVQFWLGAPDPSWLARTDVRLCVSHTRLRSRKSLPQARVPWILDSGGYTELVRHGRWTVSPQDYVSATRRYREDIGCLRWAAPQDHMAEDAVLARTGATVEQHYRRTVHNYLRLRDLDSSLPFVPVLQGRRIGDYLRCAELYARHGIDLAAEPVVGVGTLCKRRSMTTASLLIDALRRAGLTRLHGFGLTRVGLRMFGTDLVSSDSMAWSSGERFDGSPCPENSLRRDCRNCLHRAEEWARDVQAELDFLAAVLPASAVMPRAPRAT